MHKLAKGLKKKKKSKRGKKGAEEDEFNPEELERYRRERAEALEKAAQESTGEQGAGTAAAGSDEWKKFQALTAGVDDILKKTQGDLDRIKSTSFFQRVAPVVEEKKPEEDPEVKKNRERRYLGFDKDGNPIEQAADESDKRKEGQLTVSEEGFVEVPEDEDEAEDSEEEDIFDTTYVDVLQNIDVQLAYIPDSPTEEEAGDDPFDTTNADKVLKTVDKRGKKVVSLGNAVEVLSGRIDHVSTCKISRPRRAKAQDLLLGDEGDFDSLDHLDGEPSVEVEKSLLDDDTDQPDVPIDLTNLPIVLPRQPVPEADSEAEKPVEAPLDISEFEVLKEKTILEEIPDFDEDFDLDGPSDQPQLEEADDPFAEKEPEHIVPESDIIEVSFEAATFVDEDDPFDTGFAENLIPGKAELKFIEKELEELPEAEVSISLTDPAGLRRDYETGLLSQQHTASFATKRDLLGGSTTDLSQLVDQPIAPVEDIIYTDPFDTSGVHELPPGQAELKFLEKELLGETSQTVESIDDDDFDPRKEETSVVQGPPAPLPVEPAKFQVQFETEDPIPPQSRKPSRPEVLGLAARSVAFELPTPSQRPDLLKSGDEEKSIASKPLTPYYSQKSLEDTLPEDGDLEEANVDPFDTSFVTKATPGKIELKLIETELLNEEPKLTHSLSDHDFNPRPEPELGRRRSDFGPGSFRPKSLKLGESDLPLIEDSEEPKDAFEVNEAVHKRKKFESKRQESLLDAEVAVVDAKSLTPKIESKVIEEEEEISYADPFDTSIACNILPGKAELKLLESELSQVAAHPIPIRINKIDLNKVSAPPAPLLVDEDDFDPRAGEVKEAQDFLSLGDHTSEDKVLTPQHNSDFQEDIDPFDTSFAAIGPGKTELKLLESELMEK